MARLFVPLAAQPLAHYATALALRSAASKGNRRRRGDARACARTPTRTEPQRSFKMAAPEVAPMVRLPQGPQILGRATAPLAWPACAEPRGALRRARAAVAANPSHRASRTGICASSANRVKQINVARLSLGRVCSRRAGLERSVRHCTALQASCSMGVAADARKSSRSAARLIGPSKLHWSRATE